MRRVVKYVTHKRGGNGFDDDSGDDDQIVLHVEIMTLPSGYGSIVVEKKEKENPYRIVTL